MTDNVPFLSSPLSSSAAVAGQLLSSAPLPDAPDDASDDAHNSSRLHAAAGDGDDGDDDGGDDDHEDDESSSSSAAAGGGGGGSGSNKGRWTPQEDELLRSAVAQFEGKNWKEVARMIEGRSDVQCLHRWQKVLKPGLIKGPWTWYD